MSRRATVRRDCFCGASCEASSVPPGPAERVAQLFDSEHAGEGHGPATPAEARRARARADQQQPHQTSEAR